jgi:5-methylcytosine-specific restriction endonuclease McrA
MVRIPRWARTPPVTRRSVLRRDGGICVYCSEPADTIDHVIPRSRGGTHDWSNVVAACKRDNLTKADLLLSELGWTLRVKPAPPDGYLCAFVTSPMSTPFGSRILLRPLDATGRASGNGLAVLL